MTKTKGNFFTSTLNPPYIFIQVITLKGENLVEQNFSSEKNESLGEKICHQRLEIDGIKFFVGGKLRHFPQ